MFFFAVSFFFPSSKPIYSSLPSADTWRVSQSKQSVKVTGTATPASNLVKFQGFFENLCELQKTKTKGSNITLPIRKACLRFLGDNGNNRNATAKQILTWLGRMDGDKPQMNLGWYVILHKAIISERSLHTHPLWKNDFQDMILKFLFGCAEFV